MRVRKPGAKAFTFYTGVKIPERVTVIFRPTCVGIESFGKLRMIALAGLAVVEST
jgi:hypothetical protein